MKPQTENFLRLYTAEGIGPKFLKKFHRTVGTFEGDLEKLLDLFAEKERIDLRKREALKDKVLRNEDFKRSLSFLQRVGGEVIPFFDKDFPEDLKGEEIAALFVVGNPDYSKGFSVVGTRKATAEGKLKARRFASKLAAEGFTVVSGGAVGIDRSAHEGALSVGGRTMVVLGEGLAPFFERESRFAEKVLKRGGALISQFPPFMRAARWSFPKRNFLIAFFGLYGLLVVEAPKKSGSLITAKYAEELNRPIFAYIGCTSHPNHAGTVDLVSEGKARLVVDERYLLSLLKEAGNIYPNTERHSFRKSDSPSSRPMGIEAKSSSERDLKENLLSLLSEGPKTFDGLLVFTKAGEDELLTALTELELEGKIVSEGGFYRLI